SPSAACRRRHSTNCDGKRIARAADLLACAVATADCVPRVRMEFLIALCITCGEPFASAQAATIDVTVDLDADRRPLQPGIFGVSGSPDPERLAYPLLRWGGNSTTRYNWQADVHNTASDWFYMNIPDGNGTPSSSSLEAQLASTLAAGSQPLLTLSTIGWMPKPVQQKRWGFSVVKYGPQLQTECSIFGSNPPAWCTADAGDGTCNPAQNQTGFCNGAGRIVGNDPLDTSDPS